MAEGLGAQWRLVYLAARDERLGRVAVAVLMEICNRYSPKVGYASPSHSYLVDMLGAGLTSIKRGLQELKTGGYLLQLKTGTGRHPSQYKPNFDLSTGGPQTDPLKPVRGATDGPPGGPQMNVRGAVNGHQLSLSSLKKDTRTRATPVDNSGPKHVSHLTGSQKEFDAELEKQKARQRKLQ